MDAYGERRRGLGGRALRKLAGCWLILAVGCLWFAGASAVASPNGETPFEITPESFHVTPSTWQAGAHADLTVTFDFAHSETGVSKGQTYNDVHSIAVNLPAGFTASNTAVPTCTVAQLLADGEPGGIGSLCPPDTQVGAVTLDLNLTGIPERMTFPVYKMEVNIPGVAAELGFKTIIFTQLLAVNVRPGDTGLTVTTPKILEIGEAHAVSFVTWGVPWAHEHDAQRGEVCTNFGTEGDVCEDGGEEVNEPPKPFLSNPTSCGMFTAGMKADSWEEPQSEDWLQSPVEEAGRLAAIDQVGPITGCERVPFAPSIETQPTTTSAESPSGMSVTLSVPQRWESPESLSTANLKDASVTLPRGFTVNPSAGAGLGACTPEQYAAETASSPPGQGCPPESKIGSIVIETPLLNETLNGAVYIAKPYDNPFASLLALYIVAKDPERGIIIKAAGKVEPDPLTGQLITTFDDNPQQPFSRFTLRFRPGATAPLVSPPACGAYTTQAALTPWSAPLEPQLIQSQPFTITNGVHEGPCPSGGVPPFHPQVISGTQNNVAGSYSPFYLRIVREDGEQEITRFSTTLPPGLTGNLTGIPFCSETAIEEARTATGAQELEHPSCPVASEVGHSIVGAGVGTVLAQTPGKVYLAGPYHGSPLSLVSITSAKVGPFDLGTVVIRFGLNINPTTAQVEVSAGSDPIPHIIDGIVVHVRDIRVYIDRQNFTLNPTSCEHLQIQNTITGAGQDPANPADQVPFPTSTPFQAADCSSLAFKPSFAVSTTGKNTKADGAALSVNLTMPGALGTNANIHQVKVELPVQLPSRLTTLQKACTKAQFDTNPAGCPAASVVGHAKAITPILPVPLEGPAYFVSNGGEAFPNLILVLQGYGITIDLVGDTFISKQGITSSTFKTVPDQPVTSFELTLPQGPFSALTANGNLCALTKTITVKKKITVKTKGQKHTITRKVKQTIPATLTMPTEFLAQNGTTLHQNTTVAVTGCPKAKPAKKKTKPKKKHK